jgi:hypothetical protein
MTTNVTVHAVDGPVVVYFQDGSSASCTAGEEKSFQIIEGGFCTVSDAPAELDGGTPPEEGEHPPPGYILADKMIEFWNAMKDRWQAATGEPEVNPL